MSEEWPVVPFALSDSEGDGCRGIQTGFLPFMPRGTLPSVLFPFLSCPLVLPLSWTEYLDFILSRIGSHGRRRRRRVLCARSPSSLPPRNYLVNRWLLRVGLLQSKWAACLPQHSSCPLQLTFSVKCTISVVLSSVRQIIRIFMLVSFRVIISAPASLTAKTLSLAWLCRLEGT